MWAVVCYMGFCMVFGLLYYKWDVVCMWASGYKGCSICGLLNGMRAVVGYVGCCMLCGLLYDMWAGLWYVGYWI